MVGRLPKPAGNISHQLLGTQFPEPFESWGGKSSLVEALGKGSWCT